MLNIKPDFSSLFSYIKGNFVKSGFTGEYAEDTFYEIFKVVGKYNIRPAWICSMIAHESKGFPHAKNSLGCHGLIQFCPNAYPDDLQLIKDGAPDVQVDFFRRQFRGHNYYNIYEVAIQCFLPAFFEKFRNDSTLWYFEYSGASAATIKNWNPTFDVDKDGKISNRDYKDYLTREMHETCFLPPDVFEQSIMDELGITYKMGNPSLLTMRGAEPDTSDVSPEFSKLHSTLVNNFCSAGYDRAYAETVFGSIYEEVAQYGIKPNWIASVMMHESQGIPHRENSMGCVGLIQFCPQSYPNEMAKIRANPPDYQIKLIGNHYKGHTYKSVEEVSIQTFLPKFFNDVVEKKDDVIFQYEGASAENIKGWNPAFDLNGDGVITVGEYRQYLRDHLDPAAYIDDPNATDVINITTYAPNVSNFLKTNQSANYSADALNYYKTNSVSGKHFTGKSKFLRRT